MLWATGGVFSVHETTDVHCMYGMKASRVLEGAKSYRRALGDFVKGREPRKVGFYPYSSLGGGSWPVLRCVDSESAWVISSLARKLIP